MAEIILLAILVTNLFILNEIKEYEERVQQGRAFRLAIKEELVSFLFNVEVQVEGDQVGAKGLTPAPAPVTQLQYSAAEVEPTAPGGTSKNAPCPCGSGKKYKRCHGQV